MLLSFLLQSHFSSISSSSFNLFQATYLLSFCDFHQIGRHFFFHLQQNITRSCYVQGVALTFQQLARLKWWLKERPALASQTRHSSTFKLRKTVRDWSLCIICENTPWKTQMRYYHQQIFVQNQGTIFVSR